MKKVPLPVAVALALVAVMALGLMFFRSASASGGDSGNINALASDMVKANPKDAPPMPAGVNPTAGATMGGGRGKHR